MRKNASLRNAIFLRDLTQRQLAREAKVPKPRISMAIHGRYILDENEQSRVAVVLGLPRSELFGDQVTQGN